MKLIIGLGNPGKKYNKTRHNIGFMVVDKLHSKLLEFDISKWALSKKFNAEIAECSIKNKKIIIAKPMTFMNMSGQAVELIAKYYKIKPKDIIVVHDDKDMTLGKIKMHSERGDAGHKGVKSIAGYLKSNAFTRIRVGIANQDERKMKDTAKFVLNKFGIMEKMKLANSINEASQKAVELIK